jgi:hypothetical protein
VSLPASYIVNQRWPYYRNLPPSSKAFGVVMAVVPAFIIAGETAGRRYEQDNWQVTLVSMRDQNAHTPYGQGKSKSGSSEAYSPPPLRDRRMGEHDIQSESGRFYGSTPVQRHCGLLGAWNRGCIWGDHAEPVRVP